MSTVRRPAPKSKTQLDVFQDDSQGAVVTVPLTDEHGWPYRISTFNDHSYRIYIGDQWLCHAMAEQTTRLTFGPGPKI